MNFLHLDTRPDWRGGQNQILLTLRGLRARGHAAELMALSGAPLERRARAEGFRVHSFPATATRAGGAWRLARLLGEKKFDVVHAHDPHALTAAWLAGAHRRSALIVHRRVAYPLTGGRIGLARYRAARRIFAVSRFVAQSVTDSGIDPQLVEINHDGVELPASLAPESRLQARLRWGIGAEQTVLSCVGYLLPEKGQEILIRALPAVLQRFPGARLLLAGDGPCRLPLQKLTQELGLASAVIFTGFLDDVGEVYRATDVFLFPSVAEPLGSALLDALAQGLPAIAVAAGGVPEIIEDGRNGILVPSPRTEDFNLALLHLLADPQRSVELAAAGRATILEKFTADRMVEGILEKYERVLGERTD